MKLSMDTDKHGHSDRDCDIDIIKLKKEVKSLKNSLLGVCSQLKKTAWANTLLKAEIKDYKFELKARKSK